MRAVILSPSFRSLVYRQRHRSIAQLRSACVAVIAGTLSCSETPVTSPPISTATDWIWAVKGEGWNTPASDSTQAYFVSLRQQVFAINRLSGAVNWQTTLPEPGTETEGGTVGVSRGVVIAGDYDLYGLDAKTGAIRWEFFPSDGYGPGVLDFTVESDTVYLGSPSGVVYALDPTTGVPYWQTRVFASDNPTSIFLPRAEGDVVVAPFSTFAKVKPDTGGVVALDRATGSIRWLKYYPHRYPASLTTALSVGLSNGTVIGASSDGVVYAQNASTGETLWTAPPIDNQFTVSNDTRPVVAVGQRVFVGSMSGFVSAYSLSNGLLIWRSQLRQGGGTNYRMTADATNLYVTDTGGALYAFRVETGAKVFFESRAPAVTFSNAAWPGGDQVFQAADNGFYAFKKP